MLASDWSIVLDVESLTSSKENQGVTILYESPPGEVHIYQLLNFYHKMNDFSGCWPYELALMTNELSIITIHLSIMTN